MAPASSAPLMPAWRVLASQAHPPWEAQGGANGRAFPADEEAGPMPLKRKNGAGGALGRAWIEDIVTIGMPALLCGANGRVLALNHAARALLGPMLTEGQGLQEVAASPEANADLQAAWRFRAGRNVGWSHEFRALGPDNSRLDLRLDVIPVASPATNEPTWLVLVQDLTASLIHARELEIYARELSELYQASKRQLQQLRSAEKARDHFYSQVSHELKTPLTSLRAALEMLASLNVIAPSAKEAKGLLASMQRSTQRLERVINDLLDLATAKAGGLSLHLDRVDVHDVVQAVREEMAPFILEKELAVRWQVPRGKLPLVKGDRVRLHQVVQNLLSNAIKAAPQQGAVHVRAAHTPPFVRVTVVNPGVTLDPVFASSLFEPFHKSTANGYRVGAGLGLSIVDTLVKLHGGATTVAAQPDRVAFSFTIPEWEKEGDHEPQ